MDDANILPPEDPNVDDPDVDHTEDRVNNPTQIYFTQRLQYYCKEVIALCDQILNTEYTDRDKPVTYIQKDTLEKMMREFLLQKQ